LAAVASLFEVFSVLAELDADAAIVLKKGENLIQHGIGLVNIL